MDPSFFRELQQKYAKENVESLDMPESTASMFHDTACLSSTAAAIDICMQCQGQRIEKVPYNFMVLERTCTGCDGEGVIERKPQPLANSHHKQL
ncbi:hypothetical protein AaE_007861 [Aphanomyces astaci]|uniref:Uncharacterized protein n=1 Tax=Aphanomyces astaci TaxID=112090 RepID=A0A6A5AGS5_APHAT|nr:hypothetical protein AaE_007861 [Aphanomyces astaci]